ISSPDGAGAWRLTCPFDSVFGHWLAAANPPSDTPSTPAMIFHRDNDMLGLRPWGRGPGKTAGVRSRGARPRRATGRGERGARLPRQRHFPGLVGPRRFAEVLGERHP